MYQHWNSSRCVVVHKGINNTRPSRPTLSHGFMSFRLRRGERPWICLLLIDCALSAVTVQLLAQVQCTSIDDACHFFVCAGRACVLCRYVITSFLINACLHSGQLWNTFNLSESQSRWEKFKWRLTDYHIMYIDALPCPVFILLKRMVMQLQRRETRERLSSCDFLMKLNWVKCAVRLSFQNMTYIFNTKTFCCPVYSVVYKEQGWIERFALDLMETDFIQYLKMCEIWHCISCAWIHVDVMSSHCDVNSRDKLLRV